MLQSVPVKDVQPSFHAGVPVLLENWLFLSGYHGPRPVVTPVVFVPDTHYIQNGIGHVGITDNVPGAGFVVYAKVPQHFIGGFLGLGSEERGCARGMVGASTDACLEWVGVGDAVAEVCNYVAVVPPGHDTIGGVRVLECLTCRWAVVYGIEIQARVGSVVAHPGEGFVPQVVV